MNDMSDERPDENFLLPSILNDFNPTEDSSDSSTSNVHDPANDSSDSSTKLALRSSVLLRNPKAASSGTIGSGKCSTPLQLTDEEKRRKEKIKEKNRRAAAKCRKRKTDKMDELEEIINEEQTLGRNQELENAALRKQVTELTTVLDTHKGHRECKLRHIGTQQTPHFQELDVYRVAREEPLGDVENPEPGNLPNNLAPFVSTAADVAPFGPAHSHPPYCPIEQTPAFQIEQPLAFPADEQPPPPPPMPLVNLLDDTPTEENELYSVMNLPHDYHVENVGEPIQALDSDPENNNATIHSYYHELQELQELNTPIIAPDHIFPL